MWQGESYGAFLTRNGEGCFAFIAGGAARLALQLLSSVEEAAESQEGIDKLWVAEAERRFNDLCDGVVRGISSYEAFSALPEIVRGIILHPEARAEMRPAVDFYEARF